MLGHISVQAFSAPGRIPSRLIPSWQFDVAWSFGGGGGGVMAGVKLGHAASHRSNSFSDAICLTVRCIRRHSSHYYCYERRRVLRIYTVSEIALILNKINVFIVRGNSGRVMHSVGCVYV